MPQSVSSRKVANGVSSPGNSACSAGTSVVSVLVRGVSAEQCAVGFDAAAVDVSIKLDGSSEYQLSLQLFQKIVPSECKQQ